MGFLLLFHFISYIFTSKEGLVTLTDSDGSNDVLKVEIVTSDEENQRRDADQRRKNAAANQQRNDAEKDRQANAAAQAAAAHAAGSNPNPDMSPPLSAAECAAERGSVASNTSTLAAMPGLIQNGQSIIDSIKPSYESNFTQIQDASGIINKFVNEQMQAGKARAACASKMKMEEWKGEISSNPMFAAIQLFSGLTKSA